MSFWLTLGIAVSVIAIFEISRYLRKSKRPLNFPPGPPTIPVLGNLHQVPLSKPFLKFQEWSKTYGSIIGLKFGPQNVVILNDYQDVRELFTKKGSIYSGRANSYIPREIVCPDNIHILFIPHGNDFRRLRTAMSLILAPNTVQNLLPIQNAESTQLMYHLLQEPENFNEHIQRWGLAIILASVYGQRGIRHDSGMVKQFFEVQKAWTGLLEPGATPPVDIFPILAYLPESLATWKRTAKFIRKKHLKLYFALLDKVKRRMKERTDFECLLAKVLRDQGETGFSDEQIAYLGGFLMEAGSDTTSSTTLSFVLALAAHPEIQKRAQEEVDEVCGVERPPSHHDMSRLSYLKACYMEVLRWRPALPSCVPHVLDRDDTYKGYHIPKDTLVIANTWAIHHNDEEFDSPSTFNPDRWLRNPYGTKITTTETTYDDPQLLKEDSDQTTPQRRPTNAFGSGRRICPGDRMAENGILLAMSKIVWAFDIVSKDKLDVSIEEGFSAGLAIAPKPFDVDFVVRDEGRRRGLMDYFEKSEEFLRQFEE